MYARSAVRAALHGRLGALRRGLAGGRHCIGKDQTRRIESNNARQRHWFARFRRRTCVVSKSVAMVEATMALLAFYYCNGGQLTSTLVE